MSIFDIFSSSKDNNTPMSTSPLGISLIQHYEGCVLTAYRDSVGCLTVGFGHTSNVTENMSITQEDADNFLKSDLGIFEESLQKLVTVSLTQCQYDALISFVYNLGENSLKNSTLLKLLNENNVNSAAEEFLKWNHAGGKVLNGLTKRRESEKYLFLNNENNF